MKYIVVRGVLALVLVMVLSVQADGTASASSWPKTLPVKYCWQMSYVHPDCDVVNVTLYQNGSLFVDIGWASDTGQWALVQQTLTMTFNAFPTVYTGTDQGSECYLGTMRYPPANLTGAWSGCVQP